MSACSWKVMLVMASVNARSRGTMPLSPTIRLVLPKPSTKSGRANHDNRKALRGAHARRSVVGDDNGNEVGRVGLEVRRLPLENAAHRIDGGICRRAGPEAEGERLGRKIAVGGGVGDQQLALNDGLAGDGGQDWRGVGRAQHDHAESAGHPLARDAVVEHLDGELVGAGQGATGGDPGEQAGCRVDWHSGRGRGRPG